MKDVEVYNVTLRGLCPILFDRYPGDNETQLEPHEKMYFAKDEKTLIIPALNFRSFLSCQHNTSAAKLVFGKKYKQPAMAIGGFVNIEPREIVITRDGKPIKFNGFKNEVDEKAKITLNKTAARLKGGIANAKVRPELADPWELNFTVTIFANEYFNSEHIRSMFEKGGMMIGIGSWRGYYGKFEVSKWKLIEDKKKK